jgi:hypothetical protein
MDTRFNSFYSENPHPFVEAMAAVLVESGLRGFRPSFVTDYVYRKQTQKYWEDIGLMRDIAKGVLERRRASPMQKKDLINAMMYEKDPVTGKGLPEESVIDNMITFLIAGKFLLPFVSPWLMTCRARNHIWIAIIPFVPVDQEPSRNEKGARGGRLGAR